MDLQDLKKETQKIVNRVQAKKDELRPEYEKLNKQIEEEEVKAEKELEDLFASFGIKADIDMCGKFTVRYGISEYISPQKMTAG